MRFFRTLLIVLALGIFALPVMAQPKNTSILNLGDGYEILLPSGWRAADWDGDGFLVESGDSSILLLDPATMADYVRAASQGDLGEALLDAYEAYLDERLDEGDLEFSQFPPYEIAQWFFELDEGGEGVFITVELNEQTYIAFDVVAPSGERDEAVNAVKLMLASLTGVEAATSSSGTLNPVSTGGGDPCFVSVDAANSAALRVGPGTNRSSVAFLPAGVEFEVIGAATAADGSEWFKLDKADAAPRSAANEIWVAREDVDTNGDCDAVSDAVAPPVVPIINNPAPPAGGGDSGGSQGSPAVNTGSIVPQSGNWTLVFARQSSMSCAGYESITVNTAEAWTDWSESDFSYGGSLFQSGSNIVFAGDTYVPTGSPNQFVTSFDLGGNYNNQIYITFNSPTSFFGQMSGNGIFDGLACSSTTSASGRRN